MSLTQAVKEQARRLGFSLVGVTTPDPPPNLHVYEEWLASGRHGEMGYLATDQARQRRADPRQILPECQSILMLGIPYANPDSQPSPKNQPARTAAYAWGDDYHETLKDRLAALVDFIETQTGEAVPNRWYTDTGPILERDLAQRAGLGWIGKNTMLIHPQMGSYFFLAEILLGIPLDPDLPFPFDRCGACTRCIEACPTACILPNRTLDAARCISYLSIELKGPIPAKLRPQMEGWIFGCDLCQQVCPWNQRFAPPEGDPAFAPRPEVPFPNLQTDLTLTPQEFNRKFKDSPVKRAKRRGYLRNLAVALGNTGDQIAVPALAAALQQDTEPLVRGHAAWALGQLGGQAARHALQEAAQNETDEWAQEEITAALKGSVFQVGSLGD